MLRGIDKVIQYVSEIYARQIDMLQGIDKVIQYVSEIYAR